MKRGLILGGIAVASAVGSFMYPAGAYSPTVLVGEPVTLDSIGNTNQSNATTGPESRTLVGESINTRYGPVQVQINVTGTTIDSVDLLQVPTGENARFTNYSIPILIRETLKAQSSNISSVSGASYTSQGYIQSLQTAIAQI